MTTHRRAWRLRAGVVLALVTGAMFTLPATPALAAAPDINNVSASPNSVESGGTVRVTYTLEFDPGDGPADVSVASSNGRLNCVDGCNAGAVASGGQRTATFRYGNAGNSDERATITVKAVSRADNDEKTESTQVTLVGKPAAPPPQQTQTVKQVCGKVTNTASGDAVPNANVRLVDSKNNQRDTTSNGSGNFCFNGSSDNPIAPGSLQLAASKDDITTTKSLSANAGQSVNGQRLALALAEASPSASASAEPTSSLDALPTGDPEETAPPTQAGAQPASDEGAGLGQWLLIIVGGLLVALGVGAIVLLWMRRKENDGDEPDGQGPVTTGPMGAVPPSRGAYHGADDRTQLHQPGTDATMVAGGGALADAPTMMHNRPLVDDEFPDPYGAPLPSQQPGYGQQNDWAGGGYPDATQVGGYNAGYGNAPGSGAGYGNAPGSGAGYGNAPGSGAGYGNAPGSGAGYGNAPGSGAGYSNAPGSGAGYGNEQYGGQTGRYDGGGGYGAPADPYATGGYQQGDSGYGSGQAGYDQRNAGYDGAGYDQGGQGGGYGAEGGYGYGQQQSGPGGYDDHGGYGGGGYGQDQHGGGYGQGQHGGGYGQDQHGGGYGQDQHGGGYGQDQRGGGYGQDQHGGGYGQDQRGYYDQPDERQDPNRGGRRSVDWLDN
ncbi:hypothetical protein [Plantactinospora sp. GCM10030261]|uniref:carboxypeptidase-like regulatory domain-containing protein n=1 Tax=Plantactinospora sp. GCM10030261 TaxID=3273420 RepID=UPI0036213C80